MLREYEEVKVSGQTCLLTTIVLFQISDSIKGLWTFDRRWHASIGYVFNVSEVKLPISSLAGLLLP